MELCQHKKTGQQIMKVFSLKFLLVFFMAIDGAITVSPTALDTTTSLSSTVTFNSTEIATIAQSTPSLTSTEVITTVSSMTSSTYGNTSSPNTTGAITSTISTTKMASLPITSTKPNVTYVLTEQSTEYSSGMYESTTAEETTSIITISTAITSSPFSSTTPSIVWQEVNVLMRLTQSWSPNLLQETSPEYKTLENNITTNVNTTLNGTVTNVTINEVRSGSVIVDITVTTSHSKGFDILKAAIKKGAVAKLSVYSSFPILYTTSVNVTTERQIYSELEGSVNISLQCTTTKSGSNLTSGVKIMWMLNGQPIIENNNIGSRIQVTSTQNVTNKAPISKLTFKKLSLRDNGTIQCLAAGSVKSNRVSIELSVLSLPKVSITTNTPYVETGQNVTMICSIVNNVNANITFNRTKESYSGNTTKHSNGQATITLFNVTVNTNILCRATSLRGVGEANVAVNVYLPKKVTCPKDGNWSVTPAGKSSVIPCGSGLTGDKSRYCNDDGSWGQEDNETCERKEFKDIENLLDDIKDNIGNDTTFALEKLADITEENKTKQITAKELNSSINALKSVVEITDNKTEIKKSEIEGFFSVANNVIAPSEEKWTSIKKEEKNAGVDLLKSIEDFGNIVANKAVENTTAISKENLVVVVSKVSVEEKNSFPGDVKNLDEWVKESKTTMDLTSNVLTELSGGKNDSLAISVILFRNISKLLSDSKNQKSTNTTKPTEKLNTMVLSVTVGNNKSITLTTPIQLSFKHINKVENSRSLCSFWEFAKTENETGGWAQRGCEVASSNSSSTQCNCYHLTNFAVLTTLAPQHNNTALTIITYVGCGISILFCLLTSILYIIFWGNMTKSELGKSKTVLMINMCVAVILSYTLFIGGIETATANPVACKVVAVFLHFFCLSLFFSLLIYAVDMALSIFAVFPTNFNRLRFMLTSSWLLPAIIVAITLGVTKTEGYGNDKFCWLSVDTGVIWAFIGPIIFVIVVNTIILAYLFRKSISSTTIKDKSVRDKIKSGAKLLLVITPIFGITWIIGIFAVNEDTIVFQYAFTIINSLQGLFIFLVFCVFDKQFRHAITNKYNRFIDLRSTDRTILNRSKRTQFSQVTRLRDRSSNYGNATYTLSEEPVTDNIQAEPAYDGSRNEAYSVEEQANSRQRHSDDIVQSTSRSQYSVPRHSNTWNSLDDESESNLQLVNRPFSQVVPMFKGPILFTGSRIAADSIYNPYQLNDDNMY